MTKEIAMTFAKAVIADAESGHISYGIRKIFSDESKPLEVGMALDCSADMSAGENGGEYAGQLDGTCAMGFYTDDLMLELLDEDEVEKATAEVAKRICDADNKQYIGDKLLLIAGSGEEIDFDAENCRGCRNSVIIKDAVLLAISDIDI
jgi:hypothetical protein